MPREIFDPMKDEVSGEWLSYIRNNFVIYMSAAPLYYYSSEIWVFVVF
jgi:hypothetical protein